LPSSSHLILNISHHFVIKKFDQYRLTALFLGLVAFAIFGSALSKFGNLDPGPIAPVTSLLTILVGVAAIFGPKFYRLWPVLLLGTTAEIIGLYTGFPFGGYAYTDRWVPVVPLPGEHFFPVILPFAWLLMAGAAWAISPGQRWSKAVVGGLFAALIDLPMEAVMTGPLRYWQWETAGPLPGGAPITNTLGWFAVATGAGFLLNSISESDRLQRISAGFVLGGFTILLVALGLLSR